MREFVQSSRARGHSNEKIEEVWELVSGFNGYAFCKAHSTAYGVEAFQAAWLKRYYPAEFLAGVLTNGKGFYSTLVYALECLSLGIAFLPPTVNAPGPSFEPCGDRIRVPLTQMKGLSNATRDRLLREVARAPFESIRDFCERVRPSSDELENIIRAGGFDEFAAPRPHQFWQAKAAQATVSGRNGQRWLLPPPDITDRLQTPAHEPSIREKMEWETDLFGFAISGHPLDLFPNVAWETYCPVSRLKEFVGQRVMACGLVVEQRLHHQATGEMMKFLSLADKTGIVETELFASTYQSYGAATIRYPVLEVDASVEPFDNGNGFTLRIHRVGKPRER
jgi:DNA polymerase III alpha subunit